MEGGVSVYINPILDSVLVVVSYLGQLLHRLPVYILTVAQLCRVTDQREEDSTWACLPSYACMFLLWSTPALSKWPRHSACFPPRRLSLFFEGRSSGVSFISGLALKERDKEVISTAATIFFGCIDILHPMYCDILQQYILKGRSVRNVDY